MQKPKVQKFNDFASFAFSSYLPLYYYQNEKQDNQSQYSQKLWLPYSAYN